MIIPKVRRACIGRLLLVSVNTVVDVKVEVEKFRVDRALWLNCWQAGSEWRRLSPSFPELRTKKGDGHTVEGVD